MIRYSKTGKLIPYHDLNVCVPTSPDSYIEILIPKVVSEGRAFEKWLGHGSGDLMIRVGALTKKRPTELPSPFHLWGHSK